MIEVICAIANSKEDMCAIGCGPVEDLLRVDGEFCVERLEDLIADQPQLIVVVACIWAYESPYRRSIDQLLERYEQPRL